MNNTRIVATQDWVLENMVQSDWNTNDENDLSYVKNRTHWSTISQVEILPECSLEKTVEAEYFIVEQKIEAIVGNTYTVNWDGTTYTCVAGLISDVNIVYIGNGAISGNENTGEPFVIISYPDNIGSSIGIYTVIMPMYETTTCTISIVGFVEDIHKIDNKYLSDTVLASSDWKASKDELGHILNRTHYIEEIVEEIIPETTVTFGAATEPGRDTGTATGSATQIYPEYKEEFVVKWNGLNYCCEVGSYTKPSGSFGRGIGNTGMFGGQGKHYPFLIGFLTEEEAAEAGYTYMVWVNNGSTSATFSVGAVEELVHQLDEKYVPNTIARVTEIPSIEGLASESYVETKVSELVNSAPETLDTLGEVAAAIKANETVVDALNSAIGNKVDKVDGKGLSTNDYTTAEKNKLAGIEAGANAYSLPTASSSTLGGVKIGTGIGISSGVISNSGVRSISTGSTNGTISVNTNGTSAEVAVKGLGSNAYSSTAYLPLAGGTVTGVTTFSNTTAASSTTTGAVKISGGLGVAGNIYGTKVYGAVWNDYAEYRSQNEKIEAGYIVYCDDDGKLKLTTERLQKFEGVVSDTFGFAIGETDECQTPIAVSGRVLVYCNPEEHFHSGDCVCAGPDGLAYYMTREEIMEYPDRIVGIVSEIPTYEVWGSNNIKVNNRIWIRVR